MGLLFFRQSPPIPQARLSTVSVTATVVDQADVPARRNVTAFYNGNLSSALATEMSDPLTGEALFSLYGTTNTEFAFVVQGEVGENHVVHAHKTPD